MTTENQNIYMYQRETRFIELNIQTQSGTPANLSGSTIQFLAHKNGNIKISKSNGADVVITDASNGDVTIKLNPADTALLLGMYPFEIELKDSSNNISIVSTGYLNIQKSIATAD